MNTYLKTLIVDASNAFYRVNRYKVGDYFGPVDLGLHLSRRYGSLNIGAGLLAGSIFPGSNRLIFTGFAPGYRYAGNPRESGQPVNTLPEQNSRRGGAA